jgi:hypothetical protein
MKIAGSIRMVLCSKLHTLCEDRSFTVVAGRGGFNGNIRKSVVCGLARIFGRGHHEVVWGEGCW